MAVSDFYGSNFFISFNVLSTIGDGLIATDLNGIIMEMNDPAGKILRVRPDTSLGRPLPDLFSLIEKDADSKAKNYVEEVLREVLDKRNTIKKEVNLYKKRGKIRIEVFLIASPLFLRKKLVGASILFRDITKEKEIDRAKNEFVSFASHQLLSPVTVIKNYSELIARDQQKKVECQGLCQKRQEYNDQSFCTVTYSSQSYFKCDEIYAKRRQNQNRSKRSHKLGIESV